MENFTIERIIFFWDIFGGLYLLVFGMMWITYIVLIPAIPILCCLFPIPIFLTIFGFYYGVTTYYEL